jgi:nucleotide-binding universal stress UspA family protein
LYALHIAAQINDGHIILYHAFDEIVAGVDGSPLYNDVEARKNIALWGLDNVKNSFNVPAGIEISCVAEEGTVIKNVHKFAVTHHADMIVMGITGSTKLDQVMIGSTTLNVITHATIPVMIIPPEATYKGLKNVVFTSDFKDVEKTTPFASLLKVLNLFKAKLHIINVDSEHYIELTEEYKKERVIIEENLIGYTPEFSFIRSYDFIEGINRYVDSRNIDALITVPKKHNFLSQLFKTSHTKKLAYHSHVPIIAIHA